MRYVVMGAGAVGGVIGGRLHAAGLPVVLVARGDHLAALRADGLRLETPDGTEHHRIPVAASPAEAGLEPDDVVLLTVKSQHTEVALDQLVAAAPPELAVVCAQNGVDNEPRALRRFRHVYGMCVVLPAAFTRPGVVYQFSGPQAGALDLGRYPAGVDPLAERIAADLRSASFGSVADPAVMRAKHRKLLMNLGNALDALCGWEARGTELYQRAIAEGQACLAAAGIDVQSAEEEAERREGVRMRAAGGVTHSGSSTRQSLERGTGSVETDHLNGEIVLLGRLHGVATPVNEALQRTMAVAVRDGREAGSVPTDEIEALAERLGR